MAKKIFLKFFGPISSLFAGGVIVASAFLLSVVMTNYSKISYNYHGHAYEVDIDQNIDSDTDPTFFVSSQANSNSHLLLGRNSQNKHESQSIAAPSQTSRDRNVIKHDNRIIKSERPYSYEFLRQSKGPLTFDDLMNFKAKVNLEPAKLKRSVKHISGVDSGLALHADENVGVVSRCPSSNEYKVFIVLSSAGIVIGAIQMLMAALACFTTKRIAQELATLLIVYNVCSCISLAAVFCLALSKGYCIQNSLEGSEWLAFVVSLGVDCFVVFVLGSFVAYVLTTEGETEGNENHTTVSNDQNESDDEEKDFGNCTL